MHPPVEASAISRSQDNVASSGMRKRLISGKTSIFDTYLFPLFDQLTQHSRIPQLLSGLIFVYISFQMMFTSIWAANSAYWFSFIEQNNQYNRNVINSLNYISKILWFTSIKIDFSNTYSTNIIDNSDFQFDDSGYISDLLIALIVIFILSVLIIVSIILYFTKTHRYVKWSLNIIRVIFEIVAQVMIIPTSAFIGSSFMMLTKGRDTIYWCHLIIGIFMLCVYSLVYFLHIQLTTKSTILNRTISSSFEYLQTCHLFFANAFFVLMNYIFQLFPDWMMIVCAIIHLIVIIFILTKVIVQMPFHSKTGNYMFMSILTTCCFMDLLQVIFLFLSFSLSQMLILILWPIVYIISLISFSGFVFARYNKVTKDLNNQTIDGSPLSTDTDIAEKFQNLGLNMSENKALFYLRIGFTQISPNFVDFSITRFVSSYNQTNHSLSSILQIISYFPSEGRQMNTLFNVLCSKNDLKFEERFLLYQVYKLKSLRQSSTSNESNDVLTKLKAKTDQCINDTLMFWRASNPEISYFEYISNEQNKLQSLWLEAIRDYPNSSKFCEEYVRFLTECQTDFLKAINMKQRGDLIELGKNFSTDTTFRSMIRSFPDYLLKSIVDSKGNVIKKQEKRNGSSSSNNDFRPISATVLQTENTSASSTSDSSLSVSGAHELEAEVEDKLAKTMFTQSKLRLALFHALKGRKHFTLSGMPIFIAISFILGVVIFIAFYFLIMDKYKERKDSMALIWQASQTRYTLGMATFSLFLHFLNSTEKLDMSVLPFIALDTTEKILDFFHPFTWSTLLFSLESRNHMNYLINHVANMAMDNVDVFDMASFLLDQTSSACYCWDGYSVATSKVNLKGLISFSYYNQQRLVNDDNISFWYQDNNNFCELGVNLNYIAIGMNFLMNEITDYQARRGEALSDEAIIYMVALSVAVFIVSFIPLMIQSLIFVKYIDKIAYALSSISREMKEQAMKPIGKIDSGNIQQTSSEPKLGITKMVFFNIAQFFFSLAAALLILFMFWTADKKSQEIGQLVEWEKFAIMRLGSAVESALHALQAVVLSGEKQVSNFMTKDEEEMRANRAMKTLTDSNDNLLKGSNTSKPCTNYDSIIDDINSKETCHIEGQTEDFHDTYRCGSINHMISAFKDIITNILVKAQFYHNGVVDYDTASLVHLLNDHLLAQLTYVDQRFVVLIQNCYDSLVTTSLILAVFGIIICICILAYGIVIKNYASNTFITALTEVKRVPPLQMLQNKQIKNILLNKTEEIKGTGNSIARNILHKSMDGLLCTSMVGVVEIVNPAMSTILGYTPEQLLGQPVSILFDVKDSHHEKVNNEMTMMKEGQSSCLYEDHLKCISDSGQIVPCHTTILGMKRDGSIAVESFVYILRNETELIEQQEKAEIAKAQSENLLYQILPRDIVVKLNRGEKEISFTVPSASIIFIDIVKFSEYTAALTPQDIMGNLSLIFAAFDKLIKKYTLITKIKLIGDIYMAASGLFSTEDNPAEHATQIVRFGLDSLQELDDVNVKLNASLQIRIGVNTGGPLIAGVLGTDKPVFDIIGDPINVAARLQTTDIPGKIQIPQSTCSLLSQVDFNLETRGEVFLKGKGSVNTFFVNPGITFTSFELSKKTDDDSSNH